MEMPGGEIKNYLRKISPRGAQRLDIGTNPLFIASGSHHVRSAVSRVFQINRNDPRLHILEGNKSGIPAASSMVSASNRIIKIPGVHAQVAFVSHNGAAGVTALIENLSPDEDIAITSGGVVLPGDIGIGGKPNQIELDMGGEVPLNMQQGASNSRGTVMVDIINKISISIGRYFDDPVLAARAGLSQPGADAGGTVAAKPKDTLNIGELILQDDGNVSFKAALTERREVLRDDDPDDWKYIGANFQGHDAFPVSGTGDRLISRKHLGVRLHPRLPDDSPWVRRLELLQLGAMNWTRVRVV